MAIRLDREQVEDLLCALMIHVTGDPPPPFEAPTDREIGERLGVAPSTVKDHRRLYGQPRKRGRRSVLIAQIQAALRAERPARQIAADLGCTQAHVRAIRARVVTDGNARKS